MTRNLAVVVLVLVVVLLWRMMFVGWRARVRRQGDVPDLPVAPESLRNKASAGIEATYVSTTAAGDWLDRVAANGLGVRSAALVVVDPVGVLVARTGAPDVFVPAADVRDVRRETFRAGKARTGAGLVVVEWQLGTASVATALSPRHDADRDRLVDAVRALIPATGGPS